MYNPKIFSCTTICNFHSRCFAGKYKHLFALHFQGIRSPRLSSHIKLDNFCGWTFMVFIVYGILYI